MSEVVIDQATFAGLTDLVGEDFIGELTETFFEEAPTLLAEMNQALDDGDADAFRRAAHSLKSNSESFGATRLATLARELEAMGREGRLDQARPKMPLLESTYEETAQALKALL
jgi:HPt (histidine-containing phosphotransfer) domain-containing protein